MALITEDGTGRADAESYCSLADATAYHAALGNAAWAALATDELREQALRRASVYMVQAYRLRWAGYRKRDAQALDWPRYEVPKPDTSVGRFMAYYSENIVPTEVRNACAELALRAASGDLAADQGQAVIERTVGPITTKFAPGSLAAKRYVAVDRLLAPMLTDGGSSSALRLVRG